MGVITMGRVHVPQVTAGKAKLKPLNFQRHKNDLVKTARLLNEKTKS